jgi:beta-lactamase regulating signal transducer with metallopeptidase domain
MSAYSEWILLIVNLAVNLFLFGLFIAGSVAVSFGLIKNASPRLRYTVAVAAFLLAAFFPVIVTGSGSTGLEKIFEAKQNGGANAFDDNSDNQNSSAQLELNSPAPKSEAEKTSFDLLNNFTSSIADSFIGTLIFVLWVLVSAAFLSRDIIAHRQLRKARQTWREAADAERAELALPGETPLYFGEEGPATIGLLRPVIVLPEHFPDDLSLAAKRFIVQHELAHAGWRDPLVNSLLHLIRALFWISPALWMLERIAADERESAADHAVIANSSANESDYEATALNYASTLVSVAKHFNSLTRRGSLRANTIGLAGGGSRLENRVRRLLIHSSEVVLLRVLFASMIFAGSLTGMLFMPVAFQAKHTDDGDETAIITNQNPENSPEDEYLENLPIPSGQNKLPQIVENKNKEARKKVVALKQNRYQLQEFSNGTRETSEIPQLIFPLPKQTGTVNKNPDDGREKLMKRLSREDAKNSELRQKVNKLNGNLESMDDSRKNLGSDIWRMRQKAAADAKMIQIRTVVNTNQ